MISFAVTVRGQQASHWHCDVHAYQYDMSVYLQLQSQGKVLSDYSDYEIAAFCEDECRGVATILSYTTSDGTAACVVRLRARSNTAQGDTLSFKVYQRSTGIETMPVERISFESMAVLGAPSEPIVLAIDGLLLGDINSDGRVNVSDVSLLMAYLLGQIPATFNSEAADVNGDGCISIADVSRLIALLPATARAAAR